MDILAALPTPPHNQNEDIRFVKLLSLSDHALPFRVIWDPVVIHGILRSLLSKATKNHSFTHRRQCQPHKATASSSGAVRVRRLALGHLDTRLGGAGDRTSNLQVTSQPVLCSNIHTSLVHLNVVHQLLSLSALIFRCQCRSNSNTPWCTNRKLQLQLPPWLLPRNKHPALNSEHSSYKKL